MATYITLKENDTYDTKMLPIEKHVAYSHSFTGKN